jgi:hypothetical protein
MHRQFVTDYRQERYRQELDIIEKNLGYSTEIEDAKRVLREQGKPMITFQSWMVQSKRNPEDRDMQPEPSYPDPSGNRFAEEELLAVAMREPLAVDVLRQLDPEEFRATDLNKTVAETILNLEDRGVRANALAVEGHLQDIGYVQTADWDSSLPLGDIDRTDYGLQKWEKYAGVYANAEYCAAEIRLHTRAEETAGIYEWGAKAMKEVIDAGPTKAKIAQVHQEISERTEALPPDLSPAEVEIPETSLELAAARLEYKPPDLTPSPSLNSPFPGTTLTRSR